MNEQINNILHELKSEFEKDEARYIPNPAWISYQDESQPELTSLQPLAHTDLAEIDTIKTIEFSSYEEFELEYGYNFNDKYLKRLNQILYFSIQGNQEYTDLDESSIYLLHLLFFAPKNGIIQNIYIQITPEDLPKIKQLLQQSALLHLYNFSQAFK